jgi:hypothetical protein
MNKIESIIHDLSDRSLSGWDQIDPDIQGEIKKTWEGIAANADNAEQAVDKIILDWSDRSLSGWDQIDPDIQDEIRSTWVNILGASE